LTNVITNAKFAEALFGDELMAKLDWYIRAGLKPRHLQLLVAIDDLGQLTKVAELLNVTQPAVSKSLNELQSGLNLKLFERTGRGLTPTVFGECLIRYARSILNDFTLLGEELNALTTGCTRRVRLGVLPAAAGQIVPRALGLLQQESPLTTVYIRESNMDALLQEMRIGNIDLLCGTLPDKHLGLDIDEKVLTDDNTVIVVGPSHPLAGREQVAWCDLAGFPWVLPPSGSLLKTPLLAAIRRNGLSLPTVYVETLSPNVIVGLLQETDSIAFMSGTIASSYQKHNLLSIIDLDLPQLVRPVGVLWLTHRPLSKAASELITCLETVASSVHLHTPYDE